MTYNLEQRKWNKIVLHTRPNAMRWHLRASHWPEPLSIGDALIVGIISIKLYTMIPLNREFSF